MIPLEAERQHPVIVLHPRESVQRADQAMQDMGGGKGENGGEEFVKYERDLSAVLTSSWDAAVAKVLPTLNAVWGDPVKKSDTPDPAGLQFSTDRLANALEAVAPQMAAVLSATDEASVRHILDLSMLRGGKSARAEQVLREFARRDAILDGMLRSAKYYTNNYFNRFVMPGIYADVERMMSTQTPNSAEAYRAIQAAMSARLKSVPYWDVVANAAVSRGYHYGVIRGGLMVGYRGYVFVAVVDAVTSAQCRHYNGQEFWLADAAEIVDRIALAENPEEVKTIAPWLSDTQFRGMSEAEIRARGPVIPPLHGRCRSTIQLLY